MNSRHSKKLTMLFFVCTVLFGTQQIIAQTSLTPDLSITTIPSDPKPFQEVLLRAESYAIDLDQASIVWKYNGIIVASGIGKRTITVTAPGNGQTGLIDISARALGSVEATASVVIRPASVDVLWEAPDSYTPPFYKGKALPSFGAPLRFTAIPTASAPRQVVYRWSQNDSSLQSKSGYGNASITIVPEITSPSTTLSVSVQSGTFNGAGSASITGKSPSLVAYQQKDGFTDYANGTTSAIEAQGPGTTVVFEPYYFSIPKNVTSDTFFTLTVDGKEVFGSPQQNMLRFSRPDTSASASIKVDVSTLEYELQRLARTFTLSFK